MQGGELLPYFNIDNTTLQIIKDNPEVMEIEEFAEVIKKYISNINYSCTLDYYRTFRKALNLINCNHFQTMPCGLQGSLKDCIEEIEYNIKKELNYYDNTDVYTDYFDTAFYLYIAIGKYNKDYKVIK